MTRLIAPIQTSIRDDLHYRNRSLGCFDVIGHP
jgi:hypothetical protein